MKVKQLVEFLSQVDDEKEIVIEDGFSSVWMELAEIKDLEDGNLVLVTGDDIKIHD